MKSKKSQLKSRSANVCYAPDRRHSSLSSNLVALLMLRSDHATEQANKSGRTLATVQSTNDRAEKLKIDVKHLRRRALLLASYPFVRSDSDGKQRRPAWPKQYSPNIWR